jgi:fatty acid desaturase
MQQISDKQLRREIPIYYLVMLAWPVYVLVLPMIYAKFGWFSILFMIFPGAYLFVWMALLMHECWHKYIPGINHSFFYNLYSFMLITDPQIYRLIHGHHHSQVNTWADTEFHPFGKIENPILRRLHNFAEIALGTIYMIAALMYVLPKHEKYASKYRNHLHYLSITLWIVIYGSLATLSIAIFDLTISQVLIPYTIGFWISSMLTHHVQLIEHANLIIDGDLNQRRLQTRNLRSSGILETIFHFLTHADARQHVLHHTLVKEHNRPYPYKIQSPDGAVYISLKQYVPILWDMVTKG